MTLRRAPRLYLPQPLADGAEVAPSESQVRHVITVLRLGPGAPVKAFNPTDGEFLCRIGNTGGRRTTLIVERRLRPAAAEAELRLLFAPLKRARLDWLVEKATELGVSALVPVWTRYTQSERLNLDRLRAHAIAAAEQSERLGVPEIEPPTALDAALADWPADRPLVVCDESGSGEPVANALARLGPEAAGFLVGPEGGFDATELDRLGKLPFVSRVGLGPRVLRADTAAVAVVAVFQAISGDWRRARGVTGPA